MLLMCMKLYLKWDGMFAITISVDSPLGHSRLLTLSYFLSRKSTSSTRDTLTTTSFQRLSPSVNFYLKKGCNLWLSTSLTLRVFWTHIPQSSMAPTTTIGETWSTFILTRCEPEHLGYCSSTRTYFFLLTNSHYGLELMSERTPDNVRSTLVDWLRFGWHIGAEEQDWRPRTSLHCLLLWTSWSGTGIPFNQLHPCFSFWRQER